MKIFTNKKIKSLFAVILFCVFAFALISALLIIFDVKNAAAYIFVAALASFAAALINIYRYFRNQNKTIEAAEKQSRSTSPATETRV